MIPTHSIEGSRTTTTCRIIIPGEDANPTANSASPSAGSMRRAEEGPKETYHSEMHQRVKNE